MKSHALILAAALSALLAACGQPAAPAAAPAPAPEAALPAEADIAALFDRWNAALATKDPAQVAALYAADGVLQPTVSNDVRTTPEEIQAYFVDFLKLSPQGTINERTIRVLDDTTAVDAGVYTFGLTRDGKAEWVTARYTYVYELEDGVWKIKTHHSSAMPEPVAQRPAPATP